MVLVLNAADDDRWSPLFPWIDAWNLDLKIHDPCGTLDFPPDPIDPWKVGSLFGEEKVEKEAALSSTIVAQQQLDHCYTFVAKLRRNAKAQVEIFGAQSLVRMQ